MVSYLDVMVVVVVVGFVCTSDPDRYAGGCLATGRATLA
jgi:hypothetical protein